MFNRHNKPGNFCNCNHPSDIPSVYAV